MREWLVKAGLEEESIKLDLLFYPARYHEAYGSIFPMGDLATLVSFQRTRELRHHIGWFVFCVCVYVCVCVFFSD